MGDVSNMNNLARFMGSPEGQEYFDEIRRMLIGRTITEVNFSNEVHFVATMLHLDDGETFFITQPSLDVESINEQYAEVIERERQREIAEKKGGNSP